MPAPSSRLIQTLLIGGLPLLLNCAPGGAVAGESGRGEILRDVAFTHYGPYSSDAELVRRLLSPATAAQLLRESEKSGTSLAAQPVNLAAEKFIVYIPAQRPPRGYALLVFVPPWQQAGLPEGWAAVLNRFGAIFVSAARSGNDESAMGRREPLALLAAQNIIEQYPIDSERVYIAGFSGGSRIAQRLALGYPDLFRGAILNAGSDAVGEPTVSPPIPLPPRDLLLQFQDRSHLVYVTGERDASRVEDDAMSLRSMHQWCAFNVESFVEPMVEHTVAPPDALARALGRLTDGIRADPDKLARCRASLQQELEAKFQKVEALISSGQRPAAARLLDKIDRRYGGLAAPRSLELAER